MADIGIIYHFKGIIAGCKCCKELAKGDVVKIALDGTNQLWPPYILGDVYCVENTGNGRIYKIKIDDADLNGGPMPNSCNMELSCYSELEKFKDEMADIISDLQEQLDNLLP
ncbi:MAG: hypothetical protein ACO2ZD_00640 [Pseudomonadales bacterium]